MKNELPAISDLQFHFHYNPDTGDVTWKVRVNSYRGKVKPGVVAGIVRPDGRLKLGFRGKEYFVHRIAWALHYGKEPEGDIDHINGNPADNRLCNLREVPHSINIENQRKARVDNSNGRLGVSFHKQAGKYSAQIRANGKKRHLGLFLDPDDAHQAYLKAKRELHAGCTI